MHVTHKHRSLYFQLVLLLTVSAAVAVIVFELLNITGNYFIENKIMNSDYLQKQDEKYIVKLQNYIDKNQLSVRDTQQINQWVKNQHVMYLELYHDNILVYNSEYPDQELLWENNIELPEYDWNNYYSIQFVDGTGIANIYGNYNYQFSNYAIISELILSFLLFLFLVIIGIRKKINYISRLRDEIEILESGNLEYNITVKGKDKLSILANGLECMRRSFQQQVIQENNIVQENQRIITEMSHDMRTPITSIMLYTEILKKIDVNDKEKMTEYLEKIENKASQMKQLTDHLFKYSLVTGESQIELESPEKMSTIFYDLFSETSNYLQQKGMTVESEIVWDEDKVMICMDYITRIMDNITSNLLKYADPSNPIVIKSVKRQNLNGYSFENKVLELEEKKNSTGIGVNSIKNMMIKMGGTCESRQNVSTYQITILFPVLRD